MFSRGCSCAKTHVSDATRSLFSRIGCTVPNQARGYQKQSYTEQCMDAVKKYDYENFLSTLLLPQETRSTAFAIRAFNIEIAQVRDTVSETTLGRMRIQFWREAIEQIYKEAPPHSPIGYELARAVHRHKLSRRWLTQMIDAREENLTDKPFASLPKVEEYSEKSVSSVFYLILQSLGVKDVNADHAASHIGKATGIATLLRAVPFHAQRQRCTLPVDLMIMHGVSQEQVVRGENNQALQDLAFDIASQANVHLQHARAMKEDLPKEAPQAFLPAAACDAYLKSLQRADFNVFDGRLNQRNSWLPLVLYYNKFRGIF